MAKQLEGALPIIVTNYARAFGVKVRMQGCSAYTNGSTITIPRLDLSDPITSRMAYGYLAHESAHVRYSDFALRLRGFPPKGALHGGAPAGARDGALLHRGLLPALPGPEAPRSLHAEVAAP